MLPGLEGGCLPRAALTVEAHTRPAGHTVQLCGKTYALTRTEFELFQWMYLHRGLLVTRDVLLKKVWGFPGEADTRSVDMCVRRLRAKIGPGAIRTVYGKGYMMTV